MPDKINKKKIKSIFILLLKIFVSLTILFLIFKKLDYTALGRIFSSIKIKYFIYAFLMLSISFLCMIKKWSLLVKKLKKVSFLELLKIYWASDFINLFGLGAIAGETYKSTIFKSSKMKVFLSSMLDKLYSFAYFFVILISIGAYLYFKSFLLFTFTFIFLTFIFFVVNSFMFKKIKFLRKSKLDIGTKGIQQHIACSLIYLTNTAIIYLLLFKSLGVSVEIAHMFFLSVIIIFATTIPITIQGFGIREWIFVEYSKLVGISLEAGFSVAILIYLNSLMFYLLGAVPFILLRRKE